LKKFESKLANYLGVKFCFGVSSGTAALDLALRCLELEPSAEILVPANSGGYSTLSALNSNLSPKFYDVDANGLIDLQKISCYLTPETKVLVVTHLYGQMCDMNYLVAFCKENHLYLIEDCAQALGSSFEGMPAGSFGDISTFSFYPTKNLASIGDAGAIATRHSELSLKINALRQYGWTTRYSIDFNGGSNYRMDEIHALCVTAGFEALANQVDRRRAIFNEYNSVLIKYGSRLLASSHGNMAPHLAVLRVMNRENFISFFSNNNVETAIHYPIADYNQLAIRENTAQDFEGWETTLFCNQVVSIPLFPSMSESMVFRVVEVVEAFCQEYEDELFK
jgi:dTDP-4-amino-4,6-dideoxygalactose transaminase